MKSPLVRVGAVFLFVLALAGCSNSDSNDNGGGTPPLPPSASLKDKINAAAADPANDTSTNSSSAFAVLQNAGLPAVVVNSPPKVNFTVFSNGAVLKTLTVSNISVVMAKLIPSSDGNPDEWQTYTHRTRAPATAVAGRTYSDAVKATLDNPAYPQGTTTAYTDPKSGDAGQLVYNADGYYTYTFSTDITDPTKTAGVEFERNRTHRIAIQLSYPNPNDDPNISGDELIRVNPYFDITFDANGNSVAVTDPSKTRKMTDVSSCNSCHEKLALHGGGRVDTQYCVMCHNPGTTNTGDAAKDASSGKDANSGNAITLSTLVHKIHSARLLASEAATGGGEYVTIRTDDFSEVGFPQDLRNCTKCHTSANPATPQGDNWKTQVSKEACLTCHANRPGSDWYTSHEPIAALVGPGASPKDIPNGLCKDCHRAGSDDRPPSDVAPEVVHWNQNEENAAMYKMVIESAMYDAAARKVTVKYYLADPTNKNAKYNLITSDCTGSGSSASCPNTAKFGNLRLYLAYQTLKNQPLTVTEFSSYNNGGNSGNFGNAYAYRGENDGSNNYTVDLLLPPDSDTFEAAGTARVVTIGQIKEPKLEVKSSANPRPEVEPRVLINTLAQNTYMDVVLTGTWNPRREIVSNEKCNACHGALGATSGSNTAANAFHSGARNTVQACAFCHDANRAGSNIMTNGLPTPLIESYQFKRMIHGIHGNSKRTFPFTYRNKVNAAFGMDGVQLTDGYTAIVSSTSSTNPVDAPSGVTFEPWLTGSVIPAGTPLASGVENYAAEVAWPGVGINCNACHVNNSYKQDRGLLGAAVSKPINPSTKKANTDPKTWLVITPKAATCTACHDSSTAMGHVTSFGGARYGDVRQGSLWDKTDPWKPNPPTETCDDCHSSGGFKGVDYVHNQK